MIDQDSKGRWRVRVSSAGRRWRIALGAVGRPAAERRAALVVELSRHLAHRADALAVLREAALATTSEAAVLEGIAKAQKTAARPDRRQETFRSVGEAWASGELAKAHPDHVTARRTTPKGELALLCQTIGEIPIKAFTLADADRAM